MNPQVNIDRAAVTPERFVFDCLKSQPRVDVSGDDRRYGSRCVSDPPSLDAVLDVTHCGPVFTRIAISLDSRPAGLWLG